MGILQARILEWVALPSFRGSSQPREDCSHFYTSLALSVYSCTPQLFRFTCCVSAILQTNTSCKLLIPIKNIKIVLYSVQFSCLVVSDFLQPKDCSTQPGLPVHHQLPEFTQTHVHWVSDAIQPSHQWHSKTSSVTLPVF